MKKLLTAFLFLLIASTVVAQRNCPTTLNLSQMQSQDPGRYQRFADLETHRRNTQQRRFFFYKEYQ